MNNSIASIPFPENEPIKNYKPNSQEKKSVLKTYNKLKDSNIDISKDKLSCIIHLFEKYMIKSDSELLTFASLFIEQFYNELSLKYSQNINTYFVNKYKILYLINDLKKFNLDKKNLIFSINKILKNET